MLLWLFCPLLLCRCLPSGDFSLGLLVPPSTLTRSLFREYRSVLVGDSFPHRQWFWGVAWTWVRSRKDFCLMFTVINPAHAAQGVHPRCPSRTELIRGG